MYPSLSHSSRICGILVLLVAFSTLPAAFAQTYVIETLPPPLANGDSMGNGINEAGIVAGQGRSLSGFYRAVRWTQSTPVELGVMTGFSSSSASGISNNDRIVGRSGGSCFATNPTLWEAGQIVALPDVPRLSVEVYKITETGIAVGEALDSCSTPWNDAAYRWDYVPENGSWVASPLPPLEGDVDSGAYDVNAAGVVVGISGNSSETRLQACRWDEGIPSIIPDLGGEISIAMGINDNGQSAGYSQTAGGSFHAFLHNGTTPIDLGTLPGYAHSAAAKLNNDGTVIGFAFNGTGDVTLFPYFFPDANQRAFIWRNGVLLDLTLLIPPASGWTSLNAALDINELGQITGYGVMAGRYRAFRLSPVWPGDLNCDLRVNLDDVSHFVAALLTTGFTGCDINRADVNQDGQINGRDTQSFVAVVLGS